MRREITYWSGVVNALAHVPPSGYKDFIKYLEKQQRAADVMRSYDAKAKKRGSIRGSFVSFPVGDGKAFYEVCAVDKLNAYLLHVRLWDGYRCTIMEDMAEQVLLKVGGKSTITAFKVRREAAENNVRSRWDLEEMFGG